MAASTPSSRTTRDSAQDDSFLPSREDIAAGLKSLPSRDDVAAGLKSVGIDAGVMAETAKGKVGDLQELIAAEVRRKPYHALALAAAVGFLFAVTR